MTFEQDPNEKLDYDVLYDDVLASGETVASSTWEATVDGTGASATPIIGTGSYAPTATTTRTKVWLVDLSAGVSYKVINRMTTSNTPPRIYEHVIRVSCVSK